MNLTLPFGPKSYLALTGDSQCAMLASVKRSPSGAADLRILAQTDSPVTEEVAIPRLFAGAGSIRGRVSLTLPLSFFELVSLSIPIMPDGAVGKALPYHLAKSLSSPLNEYTYDWQITGRFKDRLQLTVYLFPIATFHKIRREFSRKQMEIAFFEPDVFSAFAFLAMGKSLPAEDASLCALLWPDSISLAVYEKGRLCLSRTVHSSRPQGEFALPAAPSLDDTKHEMPQAENELLVLDQGQNMGSSPADPTGILAEFCVLTTPAATGNPEPETELFSESETATSPALEHTGSETQPGASWAEYLSSIPLEIMRTRDYYAAIQKGGAIRNVFLGGADAFWPELSESCDSLLGIKCKSLAAADGSAGEAPLLSALAIGAGARW